MDPTFLWCNELIVRTDFGHHSNEDYKTISLCECKRLMKNLPCNGRGRCIVAKDSNTWLQLNGREK